MTYARYMVFPYIPTRSGFAKVILSEFAFLLAIAGFSVLTTGNPLGFPHLIVTSVVVAAVIGVDFNGTSPTYKSDLGELFYRHGHKQLVFLTGIYRLTPYGSIHIDEERCSGCTMYLQVCPRSVYRIDSTRHKAKIIQAEDCVNCGACVRQCPEHCLTIA